MTKFFVCWTRSTIDIDKEQLIGSEYESLASKYGTGFSISSPCFLLKIFSKRKNRNHKDTIVEIVNWNMYYSPQRTIKIAWK